MQKPAIASPREHFGSSLYRKIGSFASSGGIGWGSTIDGWPGAHGQLSHDVFGNGKKALTMASAASCGKLSAPMLVSGQWRSFGWAAARHVNGLAMKVLTTSAAVMGHSERWTARLKREGTRVGVEGGTGLDVG